MKQRLVAFFRHHVEEIVTPRFDEMTRQLEDVRRATEEIKRIVSDDLDASNETAALLGRAIARLQASVDDLQSQRAGHS